MNQLRAEVQKLASTNVRVLTLIEGAKRGDNDTDTIITLLEGSALATPISILGSSSASFQSEFEETLTDTSLFTRSQMFGDKFVS
jgi:hypothetical protein